MMHLKYVLGQRLRRLGIEKTVSAAQSLQTLQRILDQECAGYAPKGMIVATYVKHGIATIYVPDAIVGHALRLLSSQVLEQLREKDPKNPIKDLRCVVRQIER